jgi:transposase-like protein
MEDTKTQARIYEEPFKHAAVHFFQNSGKGIEAAAAELGLSAADLREWKRQYAMVTREKTAKPLRGMAQLRAENQALRNEILHLKVQWDVLKTTLGIMSTTVGPHESAV